MEFLERTIKERQGVPVHSCTNTNSRCEFRKNQRQVDRLHIDIHVMVVRARLEASLRRERVKGRIQTNMGGPDTCAQTRTNA